MSTIDGLTVEERGRPENGLFACDRDDCDEMKLRLAAAEARIRELEAALREIDNQGCEHRTPCLQHVGMGACPRCIARRYFARREGEKGENRG